MYTNCIFLHNEAPFVEHTKILKSTKRLVSDIIKVSRSSRLFTISQSDDNFYSAIYSI